MSTFRIPEFKPHPLVRGGHAQTIVGVFLPGVRHPYRARRHHVVLHDGDRLILHDDCPEGWQPGNRAALLIHGLAGCHLSPYMIRIAQKLNAVGIRVFRMDLRNCGAGQGLAAAPYHAGRSEDARAALETIEQLCPETPVGVIGFSLGGNIALKLLGEDPAALPSNVERGMAVCPAIDLLQCAQGLWRPGFGIYDRFFVRHLARQLAEIRKIQPDLPAAEFKRLPRRIIDFDDAYTAPVCGFETAERYYATCSAAQFIHAISTPTLIVAADDDPLVPAAIFRGLSLQKSTLVHIAESGGHMGFVGRRGVDPDCRWIDWRVVEWMTARRPDPPPQVPHKRAAGDDNVAASGARSVDSSGW